MGVMWVYHGCTILFGTALEQHKPAANPLAWSRKCRKEFPSGSDGGVK